MQCIYVLLFTLIAKKHCNHYRLWATRLRNRGTVTGVVLGEGVLNVRLRVKSEVEPHLQVCNFIYRWC